MSGKKSVKKVSSIPSYLKPTYSSLAKRVPNGSESPSDENLELFRSYSRWSNSNFSSAIDLDQQKKNRSTSVQPHDLKGTPQCHEGTLDWNPGRRNPSVSQRKSVVKDDGNKPAKLRGDLKTRGESTKNSFVAEKKKKNTKRRIPRQHSDAPSTADSALSVSPTQRLRVKKQQTSAAKLETCLSTVAVEDRSPAAQAPPPTRQAKAKPRKKTSRLSEKALVQVISRLEQQNKAVMDLYDIAILLNKRNEASKTLAPLPSTGKDLENAKKPSPKAEPHSSSLKGVIEYSKKLGNWAWSEVASSKPVRAVVAWAVLNLAIYFPSWLKPLFGCCCENGLGIFSNVGMFSSDLDMKGAASIPADLMRSALVLLAAA